MNEMRLTSLKKVLILNRTGHEVEADILLYPSLPVGGAGQMRVDCNDPGRSPGVMLPGNDFAVFPVNREELAGIMSRSER